MVGIVLVSHSSEIASGLAELAGQMAGDEVPIEPVGGGPDGGLGTNGDLVREALVRADGGSGVSASNLMISCPMRKTSFGFSSTGTSRASFL